MQKYYCPLFKKEIEEGLCIDINYEVEKIMKEEIVKIIKINLNKSNDEIALICRDCKNYPL